MSVYDTGTRHLRVCGRRGVGLKTVVSMRAHSWEAGTVTMANHTFPVRVARSRSAKYPLMFRPLRLVCWSEFDQFFGFGTAADYDPDRMVAVNADTFSEIGESTVGSQ